MEVKELGHLVLYVRDLERSRTFYRDIIGWREIGGSGEGVAMFSAGRTHHELLLIEVGASAQAIPEGRRVGLYHFGLKIVETDDELRMIFVFYSVGFCAMSLIISQLNRTVMNSSTMLALNQPELRATRNAMQFWAIAASFGLLSILLALVVADAWVAIAGYIYFALIPAIRLPLYLERRRTSQE